MSSSSFLILLDKNPQIKFVDAVIVTLSGNEYTMTFPVTEVARLIRQGELISTEVFLDNHTDNGLKNSLSKESSMGVFEPVALIRIPFEQSYENERAEILLSMTKGVANKLNSVQADYIKDPREILKRLLETFQQHHQQLMIAVEFTVSLHENDETIDAMTDVVGSNNRPFNDNCNEFIKEVEAVCLRQQIPIVTPLRLLDNYEVKVIFNASNHIVSTADYVVIIKHVMEKVARQYGINTNIFDSEEHHASQLSISLSLLDQYGDNLFNSNHSHSLLNTVNLSLWDDALFSRGLMMPYVHQDEKMTHSDIQKNIFCHQIDGENAQLIHRMGYIQSNPYLVFSAILTAVSFTIHEPNLQKQSMYKTYFGEYIFNRM